MTNNPFLGRLQIGNGTRYCFVFGAGIPAVTGTVEDIDDNSIVVDSEATFSSTVSRVVVNAARVAYVRDVKP